MHDASDLKHTDSNDKLAAGDTRNPSLFRLNPTTVTWTELRPTGPAPAPFSMFTVQIASTPDGMVYYFGSDGINGNEGGV